MKILIDTNVAIDILLFRKPWYTHSALVFSLTKQKFIQSFISATTITDIFFLTKKDLGKKRAKEEIKKLLQVFQPAAVSANDIYQALDMEWSDFEDSVQFIVGESISADYIISRNTQDFASGSIPSLTPEQFIQVITDIE